MRPRSEPRTLLSVILTGEIFLKRLVIHLTLPMSPYKHISPYITHTTAHT